MIAHIPVFIFREITEVPCETLRVINRGPFSAVVSRIFRIHCIHFAWILVLIKQYVTILEEEICDYFIDVLIKCFIVRNFESIRRQQARNFSTET